MCHLWENRNKREQKQNYLNYAERKQFLER